MDPEIFPEEMTEVRPARRTGSAPPPRPEKHRTPPGRSGRPENLRPLGGRHGRRGPGVFPAASDRRRKEDRVPLGGRPPRREVRIRPRRVPRPSEKDEIPPPDAHVRQRERVRAPFAHRMGNRNGGVLREPVPLLREGDQREHERAAPPVLPEEDGFLEGFRERLAPGGRGDKLETEETPVVQNPARSP